MNKLMCLIIFLQSMAFATNVNKNKEDKKHSHHEHGKSCHHNNPDDTPVNVQCVFGERLVNGDFESDIVSGSWQLFSNLTGWESEWTKRKTCGHQDRRQGLAELQRMSGQLPGSKQYVELDSDCDNSSNKRTTNVKLSQEFEAFVGETLTLSFYYKPRNLNKDMKLKVRFGKHVEVFKHFKNTDWKKFEKTYTIKSSDLKDGKVKLSFKDEGKADTYGMFLDNVSVKNIMCEEPITPCSHATEVISYNPVGNIALNRKDPTQALGEANGEPVTSDIKFVSLGFGGEIVLKLDYPVINKEGNDLAIAEVTGGNDPYSKYKEDADVYGSMDNINWTFLGSVKNDNGDPLLGEVDLGTMEKALYIKIVDKSPVVSGRDGFDVDAVSCLNQE